MSIALAIKTNKAPFEAKMEEACVAGINWLYGKEKGQLLIEFDDKSFLSVNETTRKLKVITQDKFYSLARNEAADLDAFYNSLIEST